MKNIIIFLLITFGYTQSMAQLSVKSKMQIEESLLHYFNTIGSEVYALPSFKQKAFTFGFIVGIDQYGKMDTVIFSNQTKKLDSLVSFKSIEARFKNISTLKSYRNTIIMGFVLVRRKQDDAITNFYDTFYRNQHKEKEDFDAYFAEMIPAIPARLNTRKVLLLPAFSLVQAGVQYLK